LIAFDLDHIPAQQIILVFDFSGPDMTMIWKLLFRPRRIWEWSMTVPLPAFNIFCRMSYRDLCFRDTATEQPPLIAGIAGPIAETVRVHTCKKM